jgi:ADP-heptose:LPS heptosyltransferase
MIYTWLRPGAVGDILMIMNLVKNFVFTYGPEELNFKCHPDIAPVVYSVLKEMGFKNILDSSHVGHFGQQINLVGYPLKEGYPNKPMRKHLIEFFADELKVEPDFDSFILNGRSRLKDLPEKYISIHPQAGWSPYKNWPMENWNMVVWQLMRQKIPVYQIGGHNDKKLPNCAGRIMVSKSTPRQEANELFNTCLNVLGHAKVHLGVDSWTNHATNIQWAGRGRTKGVILWGSTQVSASGYKHNVNISKGLPCQPCFREDPKISSMPRAKCPCPKDQTYEDPKHDCMKQITVKEVLDAALQAWEENL